MKIRLFIAATFAFCVSAFGATPSFGSFDTNDFTILPSLSNPSTIRSKGTSGTNIFNTIYVTNLYTTNITANYITVTTNITVNGTNVAVINPTDGKYPYRSGTNSFGDGAITHIDANTAGVDEMDIGTLVVTNLMTGGVVISDTGGTLTNVPVGTGALLNDGANNFSWGGLDSLWTNVAGILQPKDLTLPLMITNQVIFGPGTSNVLYRSVGALVYTNVSPGILIDNGGNSIGMTLTPASNIGFLRPGGAAVGVGLADSSANEIRLFANEFVPMQGTTLLGEPNYPWNSLYLTNQIVFGPGTTNVLYRSGEDLYYTNGSTTPAFVLLNGSGKTAQFTMTSGGGAIVEAANGQVARLISSGSGGVEYWANDFHPITTGGASLSSTNINTQWLDLGLTGVARVMGYFNSFTNYSWLAISHTGTNGAAVLDSQSAGIAGNPRNFKFNFNGTNLFSMPLSLTNPGFVVSNPTTGASATLESTSGGAAFLTGSGSSVVGLANAAHGVELFGTTFIPVADADVSLGNSSTSAWWQDLALKGIANVSGYLSGTNYARLELNHSGTNGVINFVSRANGNAGSPRPFQFTGADIILGNSHTPASSSETNYVGAMTWDASYIYVWTETNVNKRATLNAW
jgi:hypothetical protein